MCKELVIFYVERGDLELVLVERKGRVREGKARCFINFPRYPQVHSPSILSQSRGNGTSRDFDAC